MQYIHHFRTEAGHQGTLARQSSDWEAPSLALLREKVYFFHYTTTNVFIYMNLNLLESLSQLSTFDFQSQVCLSMSKANPAGQRTAANRMVPASPARSHLKNMKNTISPQYFQSGIPISYAFHCNINRESLWFLYLTTSLQSPSVVSLKYSSDTLSLQSSSGERFNSSS